MVGVTTSQTPTNITNINLCNSTLGIQTNKSDDKNKSTSKHTKNITIYVVRQDTYIHRW